MSSCIPEEIIYTEILLRLPVKTLLKFKSVCKNWYARISASDFVKLHLDFTTHTKNPFLMLETSKVESGFCSIGYDLLESPVSEIEPADIEIDYPFKSPLQYIVRLAASSYGLVCLLVMERECLVREFLCLWNPTTREYKKIPEAPIEINGRRIEFPPIRCLGYDHKTGDYKLGVGVTPRQSKDTVFQFYSLASNSWKPGPTVPYSISYIGRWHEVVVSGYHHWLVKAKGKSFLLSLDICDENFKKMHLPKQLLEKSGEDERLIPGVLEGCLCILGSSYVNGVKINVEVWEMLDYGVHESWTRRYIIAHKSIIWRRNLNIFMFWSFENRKILFLTLYGLVLYDPEHGSVRKLSKDYSFCRMAGNCIESLVSLKSGTYVGKKRE